MHIGYARVSTGEQNLDLQTDALEDEGCERVFTDELGGATAERPGLGTLQPAEVALGERRGSHAVHSTGLFTEPAAPKSPAVSPPLRANA